MMHRLSTQLAQSRTKARRTRVLRSLVETPVIARGWDSLDFHSRSVVRAIEDLAKDLEMGGTVVERRQTRIALDVFDPGPGESGTSYYSGDVCAMRHLHAFVDLYAGVEMPLALSARLSSHPGLSAGVRWVLLDMETPLEELTALQLVSLGLVDRDALASGQQLMAGAPCTLERVVEGLIDRGIDVSERELRARLSTPAKRPWERACVLVNRGDLKSEEGFVPGEEYMCMPEDALADLIGRSLCEKGVMLMEVESGRIKVGIPAPWFDADRVDTYEGDEETLQPLRFALATLLATGDRQRAMDEGYRLCLAPAMGLESRT